MKNLLLVAGLLLISHAGFAESKIYLDCRSWMHENGHDFVQGPSGRVEVEAESGEALFLGDDPLNQIGFAARYTRERNRIAIKAVVGPGDRLANAFGYAEVNSTPLVVIFPFLFLEEAELTVQCGLVQDQKQESPLLPAATPCDFADLIVPAFFPKYDTNGNRELSHGDGEFPGLGEPTSLLVAPHGARDRRARGSGSAVRSY